MIAESVEAAMFPLCFHVAEIANRRRPLDQSLTGQLVQEVEATADSAEQPYGAKLVLRVTDSHLSHSFCRSTTF